MALPVTIPNTFANATSSIPLSQLDTNFSTLANAVNGLNSGSETLANLKATTANVGVLTITGNATIGDASTDTVTLNSTLTANTAVIFAAGTSAAPSITTTGDLNTGIFFPAADTIAFAEGGAEAMRINSSGNVGIGETNPQYKLEVNGGASDAMSLFNSTNAAGAHLRFAASGTVKSYIGGAPGFLSSGTVDDLGIRAVGSILFATAGSGVDMTLDSSGNVGIGVTPSAWGTNKALQVERGGVTSYLSVQTDLFQNCYYDGSNWKYIATDEANKLTMLNGQFIMYSAPSGTAGNNITFTEVFQVNKDKTIALQGATQQTGTGITFPATQSASSDANTLDDYEEGNWTVQLQDSNGNNAVMEAGFTTATYVKIGRQVTVTGSCYTSSISGLSGAVRITGLPFTVASSDKFRGAGATSSEQLLNIASGQKLSVRIVQNSTILEFYISDDAQGGSALTAAEWSSDGYAEFTATYFTS